MTSSNFPGGLCLFLGVLWSANVLEKLSAYPKGWSYHSYQVRSYHVHIPVTI